MTGRLQRGYLAGAVVVGFALVTVTWGDLVNVPLLVTQVPRETLGAGLAVGASDSGWAAPPAGARIFLHSPSGEDRLLSEGFESACDPDVSFDGQRVLFAGRKIGTGHWRIWEIGTDGQGLRPVSPEDWDARMPIYVSTLFTLDSPEPWFTAVFVGREEAVTEAGQVGSSSLYNVKLNGTELRRLTFTPNPSLDPIQMWDGRVIYAAQSFPQEPGGAACISLCAIHVEGADVESCGSGAGARMRRMPCATDGGLVVFVEADQPTPEGAGQLACFREGRPTATYRRLTEPGAHVFLNPTPWQSNVVLVARRSVRAETPFTVVAFDADTGRCEPVIESETFHTLQAKPLRVRPRPDGHSTVVNPKHETGVFYGMNAYASEPMRQAHLKPGEIKRVRFIEGVPRAAAPASASTMGWPVVARRLVGEAPVEADGSFNVEVPADTPLLLQTLDERGLGLATCGWIWVKPKETRGCIGCHEDGELVPENEYVQALRRPSNRLTLPPAQRRTLNFRSDIAPILQRHCAASECHGGSDVALHLPLTMAASSAQACAAAYTSLLAPVAEDQGHRMPRLGRYVDAGRARTSWLVWQLVGARTDRPWDQSPDPTPARKSPKTVQQMPPAGKGTPLRAEEVRTVIQWIDLGAQYAAPETTEPPAVVVRASHP